MCLPEAQRDARLLGPEQISDREGGETQETPLRDRKLKLKLNFNFNIKIN